MNGSTPTAEAGIGKPGANWEVVGAADFNADGRDDILLQNTATGNPMIDLMNDTSVSSTVSITVGAPCVQAEVCLHSLRPTGLARSFTVVSE